MLTFYRILSEHYKRGREMKGIVGLFLVAMIFFADYPVKASDHTSHTVTIKIVGHNRIRVHNRNFNRVNDYLSWNFSASFKKLTILNTALRKQCEFDLPATGSMEIGSYLFHGDSGKRILTGHSYSEGTDKRRTSEYQNQVVITATDL